MLNILLKFKSFRWQNPGEPAITPNMSDKLQPVRGTHDILPDEFEKFHAVVSRARELAALYGFREMATPIFEMTEVFKRSMGETSDVVSKEMFAFDTKGGENVCLRPEFTAGIARAFISNGMQQHLPLKLFSTGPLFRYERPQKGRQRQFHQVNFEWLGDDSAEADVEIILLASRLLYSLSGPKKCKLHINTLGDRESRVRYRDVLVQYLTPHISNLSEDSQRRLKENPLRILDSKDPRDKEITSAAPKITDHLNDHSKARFEKICAALTSKNLPLFLELRVDHGLVRGLDYYTDTVFEFVAETDDMGSQNTVLAGGRYDGLIEYMGGRSTPAIGFAAGVERLLLLSQHEDKANLDSAHNKIYVLPEGISYEFAITAAEVVRNSLYNHKRSSAAKTQYSVETLWQGKLSKRMEKASKNNASHVIIFAPDEFLRQTCIIKNMATGNQSEFGIKELQNPEALVRILAL